MLETSTDVLKIVLAGSVGLFTLFLCWGLFYFVMTMRNVLLVTREARKVFDKVDDVLEAVKDKIHSSTSYLMIIGEAVKKIVDFLHSSEGKFHFPGFGKKKKDKKDKKAEKENKKDKSNKNKEEDIELEEDIDDSW